MTDQNSENRLNIEDALTFMKNLKKSSKNYLNFHV